MLVAGAACSAFGTRRVTALCGLAFAVAIPLPIAAPSLLTLIIAAVVFGACNGALDVASHAAAAVALGDGQGEMHVYCIHMEPGGEIGRHEAGFSQLFLVTQGSGWASAADDVRVPLQAGQGAFFQRGEFHSKGTATGMVALMIQSTQMESRAGDHAD